MTIHAVCEILGVQSFVTPVLGSCLVMLITAFVHILSVIHVPCVKQVMVML